MKTSRMTCLMIGGAAALAISLPVLAQDSDETPSARNFFLTFGQSFRATTNQALDADSEGVTYRSDTRLGFSADVVDPLNQLRFNTSTAYEIVRLPNEGTEAELAEPRLNLSYARTGPRSTLEAVANYRRDSIRFVQPLEDFVDAEGVLVLPEDTFDLEGTGQRTEYGASLRLELFRDAPLSATIALSTQQREYEDVSNPDLFDTSNDSLGVTFGARINPVSRATLGFAFSQYRADDVENTTRDRERITLGYSRQLSEVLSLSTSIGQSRIETEENGVVTETDGVVGDLEIVVDRPLGAITAGVNVTTDVNGRRFTGSLGRTLALPGASLSARIGATTIDGDEDGFETVAALSYAKELPTGNLSLSLNRSVSDIDDDEDQQIVTTIGAGYSYTINPVSSFDLQGTYANREENSLLNVNAGYRRTLTEDWSFRTGYRFIAQEDPGEDRADSHSVFFNIGRDFALPF